MTAVERDLVEHLLTGHNNGCKPLNDVDLAFVQRLDDTQRALEAESARAGKESMEPEPIWRMLVSRLGFRLPRWHDGNSARHAFGLVCEPLEYEDRSQLETLYDKVHPGKVTIV